MFLGFQPLAPGHEFVPSNPNLVSICLKYIRVKSLRRALTSLLHLINVKRDNEI